MTRVFKFDGTNISGTIMISTINQVKMLGDIGVKILKEVNIKKGSGQTGISDAVAKITKEQLIKIAKEKMPDLNTSDEEAASKIIAGTARSMGVEVSE